MQTPNSQQPSERQTLKNAAPKRVFHRVTLMPPPCTIPKPTKKVPPSEFELVVTIFAKLPGVLDRYHLDRAIQRAKRIRVRGIRFSKITFRRIQARSAHRSAAFWKTIHYRQPLSFVDSPEETEEERRDLRNWMLSLPDSELESLHLYL